MAAEQICDMPFTIQQWPGSVQRKEIEALPIDAQAAVMVMLRTMRDAGPYPVEYKVKLLSRHLRGLIQANLKINKEQIRVLYPRYSLRIVVFHVFKKTSPQAESRGYELATARRKTFEAMLASNPDDFPIIH
ncbi:MAG: type II toxin-antitoxin system RelE/ParE family toxin [Beijerinckiaceae bacterium]